MRFVFHFSFSFLIFFVYIRAFISSWQHKHYHIIINNIITIISLASMMETNGTATAIALTHTHTYIDTFSINVLLFLICHIFRRWNMKWKPSKKPHTHTHTYIRKMDICYELRTEIDEISDD